MVDVFVIVDIDRTVLDSERLLSLMYQSICDSSLHPDALTASEAKELQAFAKGQTGASFDILQHIDSVYGGRVSIDALAEDVKKTAHKNEILYEGTELLLTTLATRAEVGVGLYTYGGRRTQQMKIDLLHRCSATIRQLPAAIESDAILTLTKPERALREWFNSDTNMFDINQFGGYDSARHLIFIDDKLSNMPSSNDSAKIIDGVLIDNNVPTRSLKQFALMLQQPTKSLHAVVQQWNRHYDVDNLANL